MTTIALTYEINARQSFGSRYPAAELALLDDAQEVALSIRGELTDGNAPLDGDKVGDKRLYPYAGGIYIGLPVELLDKPLECAMLRVDVKISIVAYFMQRGLDRDRLLAMFPDLNPWP